MVNRIYRQNKKHLEVAHDTDKVHKNMFNFAKYNKGGAYFNISTECFKFTSLGYLETNYPVGIFRLQGLFISRGKFGAQPVFITDCALVNIPAHMLEVCQDILGDPQAVQAIKDGCVGFTTYAYTNKQGKQCYGVKFVGIDPDTVCVTVEIPD